MIVSICNLIGREFMLQEILMVAIGNCILKIDTLRVGRGKKNPPQTFILCAIDKLIGGVTLVGKHDGEITDLSMSQWMMTRLASASLDGVVSVSSVLFFTDNNSIFCIFFLRLASEYFEDQYRADTSIFLPQPFCHKETLMKLK